MYILIKNLNVAINIFSNHHVFVLVLVHINIFRTYHLHIFVDTQNYLPRDIALCHVCYTLPCECTKMKKECTQRLGKDL